MWGQRAGDTGGVWPLENEGQAPQRAPQEGDTLGKGKVSRRRAPAHSFQSILWAFSPLFIQNCLIHQDIR